MFLRKNPLKWFWSYIYGIKGLFLILYTIFIFSTFLFVIIDDTTYLLKYVFLTIAASAALVPQVIKLLKGISVTPKRISETGKVEMRWKVFFVVVPLLILLAKLLIYYPDLPIDSHVQYLQAMNNEYNDWHPVTHTLVFFKLPLLMTNGWIGSIYLFQAVLFSLVLGYSFYTIRKVSNTKYSIIAFLFVLLNPELTNIVLFPWKDIAFAIGALLLMTYALNIYYSSGNWIKKPLNLILFCVVFSLTTLFRHNALLFTVPLLIAIFFLIPVKRTISVVLCVLVLIAGIKVPLYSALNVESPDKRQVETLGFPMTVIGACITYAPDKLDEETRDFAYKVAPKDVWEEKYSYGDFNNVKFHEKTNMNVIEEYGTGKIMSMTLKCIACCPKESIKGMICLTEPVYTVSDNYLFYEIPKNDPSSANGFHGIPFLQNLLTKLSIGIFVIFPWLFMYIGSMHYTLLASAAAKCSLRKREHRKKLLLILPAFTYNFGTSLLLTGAGDSSRFFFYTFLLMPALIVLLYRKEETA